MMENDAALHSYHGGDGSSGPVFRILGALKAGLDWSARMVAACSLLFLFIVLFLNIILRYFFGSGIAWAYEIHGLLLPWLIASGLLMAAVEGRNIAITLLPEMLSPQLQRVLLTLVHISTLAICISVLMSSTPILRATKYQTFSAININQIWGYYSLVYAFVGMAIIAAIDAICLLLGRTVGTFDHGSSSLS